MEGHTQPEFGRPVIAVLPFSVAPADAEVSLLAAGIHENICGDLSRFRGLAVISPASSAVVAALRDNRVGIRLGASHVLRGRIRRSGARMQISASLSSVRGAAQLWAEQFELGEGDMAACEDMMIARIAATLNVKLEEATLAAAQRRPVTSLAACELTLRGLHLVRQGTREANDAASALFEQALALDPHYARAHSGLSLCWFSQWNCQNWDRFEEASQKAYLHAREALELSSRNHPPRQLAMG